MNKTSVILMVILFSLIIAITIGIMPYAMINNSINLAHNEALANQSLSTSLETLLKSEFGIVIYLLALISIILILFGAYFIKNKECKNYVGTIFIVSACILLAFTAIFGFQLMNMTNFI